MAPLGDVESITAATSAIIADDQNILRGSQLLASDGNARCYLSDGCASILNTSASQLRAPLNFQGISEHAVKGKNPQVPVVVSFVCVGPAPDGGNFAAFADDMQLHVMTLDPRSADDLVTLTGVLVAPMRWLSACWHPDVPGLLAAICQAEVRVAFCTSAADAEHGFGATCVGSKQDVARTDGCPQAVKCLPDGSAPPLRPRTRPTPVCPAASLRPPATTLPPPPTASATSTQPGADTPVCRSTQCHVAWVGAQEPSPGAGCGGDAACSGHGDRFAEPACVTLVVAWGPDLELVTWSTAEVRKHAASAAASASAVTGAVAHKQGHTGAGGDGGGVSAGPSGAVLVSPGSRRTLLLGVPAPLSAIAQGPYGSVLATTDVGLALPSAQQATQPEQLGGAGGSGRGGTAGSGGRSGRAGVQKAGANGVGSRTGDSLAAEGERSACQESVGASDGPDPSGMAAVSCDDDRAAGPSPPEVLDLRGGLAAGTAATGLQLSVGGSGSVAGGSGLTLAGLFNITALGGSGVSHAGRGAAVGGAGAAASAAASRLLLGKVREGDAAGPTAAAVAGGAALCVVWPGPDLGPSHDTPGQEVSGSRPGHTASLASPSPTAPLQYPLIEHVPGSAAGSASEPGANHGSRGPDGRMSANMEGGGSVGDGGFCSLASLPLPRPDLLACCGSLVLAASSLGAPLVAAFSLAPRGGLTRLALIQPALPPGLVDAARCRLRGLAAVRPTPGALGRPHGSDFGSSCGGTAAHAGLSDPAGGTTSGAVNGSAGGKRTAMDPEAEARAMLVVVVGQLEQPAAGGGIVGFNRSGRPAGQRMAPLVVSAHPLPKPLADCAAVDATLAGATGCSSAVAESRSESTFVTRTAAAGQPSGRYGAGAVVGPAVAASGGPRPVGMPVEAAATTASGKRAEAPGGVCGGDGDGGGGGGGAEADARLSASGRPPAAVEQSSGSAPTTEAATAAAEAVAEAVLRQFGRMLDELRNHLDRRMDDLAGSLQAYHARLERLESSLASRRT